MELGIAPDYILDRMDFYEIPPLIEGLWRKNKDSWEQARMMTWMTAQVNSTKKLEISDVMTFPWEKNIEKIEDTEEDIKNLYDEMKQYENKLNNNG